ncbi:unnamed protein product [Alopecurus aequalis]
MSRNNGSGNGCWNGKLELNLNLSPSPPVAAVELMEVDGGLDDDDSSNYSSSPSSCMSSDSDDSPDGTKLSPMMIGACERCLMYCMVLREEYPTCINCKQPCLVDVLPATAGDDKKAGTGQ